MSHLIEKAMDYERKAEVETSPFRARCYRRLAALAIEVNAESIAARVQSGSPIEDELSAMIDAANAHLLEGL